MVAAAWIQAALSIAESSLMKDSLSRAAFSEVESLCDPTSENAALLFENIGRFHPSRSNRWFDLEEYRPSARVATAGHGRPGRRARVCRRAAARAARRRPAAG